MAMLTAYIDDLSNTLTAVLHDPGFNAMFPELKNAEIIFDRPLDPFKPPSTSIDLFLYDIREDLDLRSNERISTRIGNQVITHPAPLRLACSYLVTAWPADGLDLPMQEQRLLSEALVVLSHYPIIPANFLQGSLVGQDPLPPMVALHPDALKNLAEFWTSLGSRLKPSLTVTVTISVPVFSDVSDFPVIIPNISVLHDQPPVTEILLELGGQVVDPGSQGVPDAIIDILDAAAAPVSPQQTSGPDGRFVFTQVNPGNFNMRAVAVGFKPQIQPISIPGLANEYVIQLTPL